MRTRIYWGKYSTICGLAIRYGDDVVVLDGCQGRTHEINFPSKKPLNPAMKVVKKSAKEFQVFLLLMFLHFHLYFTRNYLWYVIIFVFRGILRQEQV